MCTKEPIFSSLSDPSLFYLFHFSFGISNGTWAPCLLFYIWCISLGLTMNSIGTFHRSFEPCFLAALSLSLSENLFVLWFMIEIPLKIVKRRVKRWKEGYLSYILYLQFLMYMSSLAILRKKRIPFVVTVLSYLACMKRKPIILIR